MQRARTTSALVLLMMAKQAKKAKAFAGFSAIYLVSRT
jgi:hypothetical protein